MPSGRPPRASRDPGDSCVVKLLGIFLEEIELCDEGVELTEYASLRGDSHDVLATEEFVGETSSSCLVLKKDLEMLCSPPCMVLLLESGKAILVEEGWAIAMSSPCPLFESDTAEFCTSKCFDLLLK